MQTPIIGPNSMTIDDLHARLTRIRGLSAFRSPLRIRRYVPGTRVAFMHVPKCSGNAMTKAVIDSIRPRAVCFGYDRSTFGSFTEFDTITPEARKQIYVDANTLPRDVDFIWGHMARSTLAGRYPDAQLITLLREPVCRVISHWLFWRGLPDEELRPWGGYAPYFHEARKPLGDFLASGDIACQIDNPLVRLLLWPHSMLPDAGFIAERSDKVLLRQAIGRIREFSFIDVVENPGLQDNLIKWNGQLSTYPRVNETPRIPPDLRTPLHSELVRRTYELLKARTRLDRAVWLAVACWRMQRDSVDALREETVLRSIARFASLVGLS
jgi:hypothetical protein